MVRNALVLVFVFAAGLPLAAQSEEFGKWRSLWNGKDASGWLVAKDDKVIPAPWKTADAAFTNGGDGGKDICTAEQFENYELELDYKVAKGGNSGVYLRGWIEIQILDANGQPQPRDFDAGAIYGQHAPLKLASKPAGEWNHFRILHVGDRVTVRLNGALLQDDVFQPKSTAGHMGEFPGTEADFDGKRGPIMLQGDHSQVWFKDIKIRPLVSASDGWRPLWNGKDLSEFTAHGDQRAKDGLRWKLEDGAFTNAQWRGQGHDIWTNDSFGNFLVHYEYKSDPNVEGGNAGFYLRDQWEIQIFKETTTDPHTDGSLYSIHSVPSPARNAPDQWNQMDVKVDGMKIWVWQNGKLIHDGKVCETRTDNHDVKTDKWTKAPFKLQGDHGKVWFTNLFIKPLADTK